MEVSLTVVDALAPPAVTVRVSAPSVKLSLIRFTDMVATPLELITAVPLKPPETSAAETPESVYGTAAPAGTLVVESVKVALEPSLTSEPPALKE